MWQSRTIADTIGELSSSAQEGLSSAEAAKRLAQYGPNQLKEKPKPSFLQRLWNQLNNFLIMILIVAAVISVVIGIGHYRQSGDTSEFIEAFAIMAIIVLNAVLGLVQEGKAEQALEALKKMAAPTAMVLRDGLQQGIASAELVPGDIVVLDTGNHVPADVRLIESANLRIEEASLTGESVPVEKRAEDLVDEKAGIGDRSNMGFMSTTVTYGRGRALVVATGMQTEIGKIAETPRPSRSSWSSSASGWALRR
jgi:Ca2+-transporting ATPase